MSVDPGPAPTRDEVEARMNALLARVPTRRAHDLDVYEGRVAQPMSRVDELESLARLAALRARVDAMGDENGGPRG